jgi:hypothetical protein
MTNLPHCSSNVAIRHNDATRHCDGNVTLRRDFALSRHNRQRSYMPMLDDGPIRVSQPGIDGLPEWMEKDCDYCVFHFPFLRVL